MSLLTVKKIGIINSRSPYGDNAGKDALDLALIFGSYEQQISLFFHGDGVYQLITQQSPELIQQKNYLKTFGAFELYDVNHIYVCQQSLKQRQLTNAFHIDNVTILDDEAFKDKLSQQQAIFRF